MTFLFAFLFDFVVGVDIFGQIVGRRHGLDEPAAARCVALRWMFRLEPVRVLMSVT